MCFIAQSFGYRAGDRLDKGIIPQGMGKEISKKCLPSKIALKERFPLANISIHHVMSRKLCYVLERECKDVSSSFFRELAIFLFWQDT